MFDNKTAPYGVLLLRALLGFSFLAHVSVKLFVYTVPGFVSYFGSLGLPPVLAYLTIMLELLGSLALILGIYARWVAVPLVFELLGTIAVVHSKLGWEFNNSGGGWEYPAFWAIALVVFILLGDGPYALLPSRRVE
ncbi:DoxX family protein [Pseudomonas gingeri]|uniref:DoxX family protein n=1 Tax=Pseudomonas gingeri TaxID=117681 RepID=A0A7Y7YFA7_9PSED|nr:DoxX family protein [Pseudomonas gingeri]NWA02700.1 DoxX family protein [Pseudomonas gingeri]NWA12126.1 DoxX family protein [Pseudomonas gingeri]NWA57467.1 DoxX family protein [Pseudomonas gingeri]NWA93810.1 DoxX family protein [Pseudomonas gingeri]NWB03282.1 DoxX family protein [Pseudomonas gingeri]